MFQPSKSKTDFTIPAVEVYGLRLTLETVPNKKMCVTYRLVVQPAEGHTLTQPDDNLLVGPSENSLHGKVDVDETTFTPNLITIVFDLTREKIPEGFEFEEVGFLCQVAQDIQLKQKPKITARASAGTAI